MKTILALTICIPFWFIMMVLCTRAMDCFLSVLESLDDTIVIGFLVKPLAGLIISVVVPCVFLLLGIGLWILAESIFGFIN